MTSLKLIAKPVLFLIPAGKEMLGLILCPEQVGGEYASLVTLSFTLSTSPIMLIYFASFAPNNMQNIAHFFDFLSFVLWLGGWILYLKIKKIYG